MGQTVKKVDLHKSGKKVIIDFDQSSFDAKGEIVETSSKVTVKKAPSEELTNCFLKMGPHLMHLCEFVKIKKTDADFFNNYDFLEVDDFKGVNVTAVVISGKESNLLTLVGSKTTENGDVINFNSPAIDLEDPAVNAYPLRNILYSNLEELKEAALDFHNKNHIVITQQELF